MTVGAPPAARAVPQAAPAPGKGGAILVSGAAAAGLLAVLTATWVTLPGAVPGIAVPGAAVDYGLPVARLAVDLAATAAVGLSLLPKLLGFADPERTEPVAARARHWAVVAALIWGAAALVSAVLGAAELMPGAAPDVAAYVDRIPAGQGLVISASCALVSAAVGLLAVRFGEKVPAELRVLIAGFGLLPLPVTGHASNWYWHDLSMVSMEFHVLGAAAWSGGLLALAVLLPRRLDLLADTLPKFSKLATVALIVVGLSGVFNGVVELLLAPAEPFPASLVTTGYGWLILAKIACTAAIALFGAHIRWRLLPRVRQGGRTAFATWAGAEIAVMALAYGVAVALTRAPVA